MMNSSDPAHDAFNPTTSTSLLEEHPSQGPNAEVLTPGTRERPSTAIFSGADALLALFSSEQTKHTHAYLASLNTIEADYERTKAESTHAVANAKAETVYVQAEAARTQEEADWRLYMVEKERRRADESQAETWAALQKLRTENDSLRQELASIGLDVIDGHVRFNARTTRIVDDFVRGARLQEDAIQAPTTTTLNQLLVQPVGPAQFFDVVDLVLNRSRQYTESMSQVQSSDGISTTNTGKRISSYSPPSSPTKIQRTS